MGLQEQQFAEQQRQNEFSNQLALQSLATQAEQIEYQKQRDLIGDNFRQQQFDENVRQFGLNYAIQQSQLGIAQSREARAIAQERAQAEQVDISQYTPTLDYLYREDPDAALEYINTIAVDDNTRLSLMRRYGVTPELQTTTRGQLDFAPVLAGESIVSPRQPVEEPEEYYRPLSVNDFNKTIDSINEKYTSGTTGVSGVFLPNKYNIEGALREIFSYPANDQDLKRMAAAAIAEYERITGETYTQE